MITEANKKIAKYIEESDQRELDKVIKSIDVTELTVPEDRPSLSLHISALWRMIHTQATPSKDKPKLKGHYNLLVTHFNNKFERLYKLAY